MKSEPLESTDETKRSLPLRRINDGWIFYFVHPLIAILVVHIGNDNSFYDLIQIPSYYTDLLFAFACTYSLGFYFKWLFYKLDGWYNWGEEMRLRIITQATLGLLAPVVVIIGLEFLYLKSLPNVLIESSSIFYLELPLVAIFCVLLNLIYSILYYRLHSIETTRELKNKLEKHANDRNGKSNFLVHYGSKSLNISLNEIAYFIVLDKMTYLITHNGKQYLYNSTLEQVSEAMSPHNFFQINRQLVARKESIVSYKKTDTRKLKISLNPPVPTPVFVSKTKAPQFITWLES
ncbi:LytR/AlgR family response regulator transcription factor [Fulvivirga lutea]|uniref:LytTR family transcriptional regulator DNA-binding domain-containing protein n=1 Tax=Fulvivirga lutea TaxID=2810512 RepID=A0A975A1T3_9BACT|nr:LytTR family DNA-binding domain-containing protein [Fulvivirga lutea]QSE97842.1 LytTR family transcriptional regulator DNA-binding domain-containing protein [Fulvivirga lutea]